MHLATQNSRKPRIGKIFAPRFLKQHRFILKLAQCVSVWCGCSNWLEQLEMASTMNQGGYSVRTISGSKLIFKRVPVAAASRCSVCVEGRDRPLSSLAMTD